MNGNLVKITETISYLPATEFPLSADVVFIKTPQTTWIFDTGTTDEAAESINQISGRKNIVLSHFHPDHCQNLSRITYDELFLSPHTKKYFHTGTEIISPASFENGAVTVFPVPSSHAKGSLGILSGNYAFLGDSVYSTQKKGQTVYNAQLLNEMLKTLEDLPCDFFCLSHKKKFVAEKETVLSFYRKIYSSRQQNQPYINC